MDIKCDKCGEILTEQGGLAFSPPSNNIVTKYHICTECWKTFTSWLLNDKNID